MLKKKINKDVLKAFIQRKKINALGLIVITAISAVCTLLGAVTGFHRTDILAIITMIMVLLCLLQMIKNRRGFRTLRSSKTLRRKKREPKAE
ncbi:MAG: hypothetical protein ACI4MM_00290 [Candidatus Ventricola sp.]